jgi:polysaccharide deacetylase family protein (PEP-CTERM system associated)
MQGRLALSIDLDEWYHTRWCTGSPNALWSTTSEFFRDYYGQDRPIGELIEPTEYLLDVLDQHSIKVTFFILGEVARNYPDLVHKLARHGHEIACHGLHHIDMHGLDQADFVSQITEAKAILQEITGQKVRGFRAPNALLPSYLVAALEEAGFCYDSSMFPSRKFMGKYGYTRAPLHPYTPSRSDIQEMGQSDIVELPVAVFPHIRLVAGSGIFTRVFGYWWTRAALKRLLRTGDTVYYFHPYELMPAPRLQGMGIQQKVFLRNCGKTMRRYLEQLLRDFHGKFVTARELVQLHKE